MVAKVASMNPRRRLSMVTWNVGSLAKHMPSVLQILASERPHLLCLQECTNTCGAYSALVVESQALGYQVIIQPAGVLVTIGLRGLNIAPLPSEPIDGSGVGVVSRLAWQIQDTRLLLRHRHAHPRNPAHRATLNTTLAAEPHGEVCTDIGDRNGKPSAYDGCSLLFTSLPTYWRDPSSDKWLTIIDGAAVSPLLARDASVQRL